MRGKVLLISGGTQGLGAGIALAAAAQEAEAVAVVGRNADNGMETVQRLEASGTQATFIKADLTDMVQVGTVVESAVERLGRVDALVNAAGLTTRGTMLDTTEELFDAHVALNLKAPFFLMQQAIRHLRERGAAGNIANIITMSSHGGQPYLAPYVATKAGLAGLTRNAAHAHRWDRIRINGVNIGWTSTEGEDAVQRRFHGAGDDWLEKASASQPMGKLGQVEEIGDFVVFLLSERSGVVTGSVIDWDQNVPGAYD
ncbi:short chain dehydrogenase [Arthrobacter crystallopoietes BAB-32]|uniref:Short chain dehydrogenase n=1 Tax=Arthrobacter crystallopoietes BAB-32 TaxID=1246476 RepID=N1USM2_9MICC|nr:SDR family oxidoreductase [Arthrobacter crystallopoietes]EMY33411.1 short chain dehydrogenase [Arthrobacter crystallopoietes BAB-32]